MIGIEIPVSQKVPSNNAWANIVTKQPTKKHKKNNKDQSEQEGLIVINTSPMKTRNPSIQERIQTQHYKVSYFN